MGAHYSVPEEPSLCSKCKGELDTHKKENEEEQSGTDGESQRRLNDCKNEIEMIHKRINELFKEVMIDLSQNEYLENVQIGYHNQMVVELDKEAIIHKIEDSAAKILRIITILTEKTNAAVEAQGSLAVDLKMTEARMKEWLDNVRDLVQQVKSSQDDIGQSIVSELEDLLQEKTDEEIFLCCFQILRENKYGSAIYFFDLPRNVKMAVRRLKTRIDPNEEESQWEQFSKNLEIVVTPKGSKDRPEPCCLDMYVRILNKFQSKHSQKTEKELVQELMKSLREHYKKLVRNSAAGRKSALISEPANIEQSPQGCVVPRKEGDIPHSMEERTAFIARGISLLLEKAERKSARRSSYRDLTCGLKPLGPKKLYLQLYSRCRDAGAVSVLTTIGEQMQQLLEGLHEERTVRLSAVSLARSKAPLVLLYRGTPSLKQQVQEDLVELPVKFQPKRIAVVVLNFNQHLTPLTEASQVTLDSLPQKPGVIVDVVCGAVAMYYCQENTHALDRLKMFVARQ